MITIEEGDYTPFFRAFLDGVQSGDWEMKPLALRNLGISPEHWLKEAAPGRVRYVWPNDGSRDIQPGRAFGGWVGALSDHVVSICMFSALTGDEGFTTQDLQVKLFRPVPNGDIEIRAQVVNRSRSTGYVEAEWRGPDGKLLVKVLAWKAIRETGALGPRS
ncbi:MAG: PaaI family thioesterase [Alphaproteobacteria bacterium]|jgi:acyl-coenzyme A thioesterase PaaI-like protein|nr:PaaI family thioesterase [Alphaproteobacteria bacterium]